MENDSTIKCPQCGTIINVSELLYHQVEDQLKRDFDAKNAKKDLEIQNKLNEIKAAREQVDLDKENLQEQVEAAIKTKLTIEKGIIEKKIREQITTETSDEMSLLKEELGKKTNQVKELNKTRAEIEQLKREKDELQGKIEAEKEVEFSNKLKEEKAKIQRQVDESSNLKIRELENQLNVQIELAKEMKRKAEQGSMQLQGEIQELALEEALRNLFPLDIISEVGKGIKGADAVQHVRNKIGIECGTIIYESKRTKSFSNEWVNKLKKDAVAIKADISVIVTEAMPDGMDRIGQKDGVWICSFNDFRGLVLVLRESLIKINEAYETQSNKGEKMQMLYDYLTGNEFRLQIGAIIEGFTDLHNNYTQERRAMERIWKQREKQLEKVLLNTNHFIGSIKGIAGSSIPDLNQIGNRDNILELEG